MGSVSIKRSIIMMIQTIYYVIRAMLRRGKCDEGVNCLVEETGQ